MSGDENIVIQFRSQSCFHHNLLFDEALSTVECKKCGEKLNPFFAIKQLMRLSSKWAREFAELQLEREAAAKKKHTKCQHCKKMTRVRTDVTHCQIVDRMRENGVKI